MWIVIIQMTIQFVHSVVDTVDNVDFEYSLNSHCQNKKIFSYSPESSINQKRSSSLKSGRQLGKSAIIRKMASGA